MLSVVTATPLKPNPPLEVVPADQAKAESRAVSRKKRGYLGLGSRPPLRLRGVSRALRARNPQRVSRGLPAPGSKKCPKQSRKSLRSPKTVFFETLETLPRLFRKLFRPPGRKALGDSFGDFLGIPGPKGPESCSKGRAGSQILGEFGVFELEEQGQCKKKTTPKFANCADSCEIFLSF